MPILPIIPLFLVGVFGAWLAKGISGGGWRLSVFRNCLRSEGIVIDHEDSVERVEEIDQGRFIAE